MSLLILQLQMKEGANYDDVLSLADHFFHEQIPDADVSVSCVRSSPNDVLMPYRKPETTLGVEPIIVHAVIGAGIAIAHYIIVEIKMSNMRQEIQEVKEIVKKFAEASGSIENTKIDTIDE